MYYATYEKQLIKAYNKTNLYEILSVPLALPLIDTYRQFKRGMTVKQVIAVLQAELNKPGADYNSIQLALNETQPNGVRHDA